MARSYRVIEADGHGLEPADLWDRYMNPAYRGHAPRLFVDHDGKERLRVADQVISGPKGLGHLGAIGARQGGIPEQMRYVDGRKGGFDPHERIKDMDLDGIDAAFLYPSLGLFTGAAKDPELAAAMCRVYNRWLVDYCQPYPDRLFGVAMLPMQSVELAIAEMRYARGELGMRGAFCPPTRTTGACCTTPTTIRSGPKPRRSTSPSACMREAAAAAASPPSGSIASKTVAHATSSRTPWKGSLSVLADYIGPEKIL